MKNIHIWFILFASMVLSPYLAHRTHAHCTQKNGNHTNKHVSICTYSQKDLNRILKDNKDRYEGHCAGHTCFYCGCPVSSHAIE